MVTKLQTLYHDLTVRLGYTPPKPRSKPPSFLERSPRLKLAVSLGFTVFIIFCDGFVGISTIVSGLLTLGGVIFVLSLSVAVVLMVLVTLLQFSLLSKILDLPFLKPPPHIQLMITERAELKQIAALMDTKYFERGRLNGTISNDEHQALIHLITGRSQWLEGQAAKLEEKRQSQKLSIYRVIAILFFSASSLSGGFSTGYFFISALTLCFPFVMPLWLPLIFGVLAGIAALAIFWDQQKNAVAEMIGWAYGCDKSWIKAMTQDIILPQLDVTPTPPPPLSAEEEERVVRQHLENMAPCSAKARLALSIFKIRDDQHDNQNRIPQGLSTLPIQSQACSSML